MFAIAFDMKISKLKEYYGEPYNNAYFEIGSMLRNYDFYNAQGSIYITKKNDMANLHKAIEALKKITWFKSAVRDIRVFRVEDWSDFTGVVKDE
jgi:virulence-associated protein VapD